MYGLFKPFNGFEPFRFITVPLYNHQNKIQVSSDKKVKLYEELYLEKVEEKMLCQWSNGRDIIYYETKDTVKILKDEYYNTDVFNVMEVEFVNKFDCFMENIKMKLLSQNTKLNFKIQILNRNFVVF